MKNIRKVPVNIPVLNGNEKKYLLDCIETGWISSSGHYIEKFEQEIAKYVGVKHAISVCNGTAALEAAVLGLNLPVGSEVIMPDFTIISCAQSITKAGLKPVYIDCKLETWNMDEDKIEKKINSNTKAIMVVHLYGIPCNMKPIIKLASKYNLKIIEDAAEAHGLTCYGKQCASFGDVSIFSFFPNKHITTGEGGMVMTNDDTVADRVKKIRNLFFDLERRYIHEEIGSNFRMTNMQAAVGLAQIEHIEWTLKRKREIGSFYQEKLRCLEDKVILPLKNTDYADNIYWVFGLVLKDEKISADFVMAKLKELGVETRHFFYPMHLQPCLVKLGFADGMHSDEYKNSEFISSHGFYIPSGVGLTIEDQEYVVDCLKQIFGDLDEKTN